MNQPVKVGDSFSAFATQTKFRAIALFEAKSLAAVNARRPLMRFHDLNAHCQPALSMQPAPSGRLAEKVTADALGLNEVAPSLRGVFRLQLEPEIPPPHLDRLVSGAADPVEWVHNHVTGFTV